MFLFFFSELNHLILDGTLFKFDEEQIDWKNAKRKCEDKGMRLAVDPSDTDILALQIR